MIVKDSISLRVALIIRCHSFFMAKLSFILFILCAVRVLNFDKNNFYMKTNICDAIAIILLFSGMCGNLGLVVMWM